MARPRRSRPARRAPRPSGGLIAHGILHFSAVVYALMGLGFAHMCFTAEVDPQRGSPTGILVLGVFSLLLMGGLAFGVEMISRGIRQSKDWAFRFGYGFFFLYCTSIIGIPIGMAGIWSLQAIDPGDEDDEEQARRPRKKRRRAS